jgi:sporulation protein YlmC with PRC-barrel domain
MNGKAKWVGVSWMAVALLPLLAGLAGAVNPTMPQTNQPNQQDEQVATSPTPDQTAGVQPQLDRAKDLIGAKIVNDKGERLGTVADIVLTPERDAVNYVVLSHGGTWGMGEKYFAVPWSQFGIQAGEKGGKEKLLVLKNITAQELDNAKGFDKDHWPTVASENWLGSERDINRNPEQTPSTNSAVRLLAYPEQENQGVTDANGDQGLFTAPASGEYANPEGTVTREPPASRRDESAQATEPGRGSSPNTGRSGIIGRDDTSANAAPVGIDRLRLSKVLGTKIENPKGEDLGKLDNVMIDVREGKVAFGIVSLRSGFLGLNKDYVAVPWSALDLTSQPGIAKLDADKETLTAMAFNKDNFPNLADPQYSRQLYERFHATPYSETLGYVPGEEKPSDNAPAPGMTAPKTENPPTPQVIADKHVMAYNPNTVRTIRGTVQSIDTHRIKGTSMEELRLHVKADDGKMMIVHVGPRSYVDRQNISFHPGDAVTITGSLTKAGRHEALVASQIQTADKTLSLRDQSGKPLWNPELYGSPRAPRGSGQMQNSYQF